MITVPEIILLLSTIGLIFCFFMMYRNNLVYNKRVYLLNKDYYKFKKLCSYDKMMIRFWDFNVDNFVGEE